MNDSETTVAELRALLTRFVAERNWESFHTPKNLVMSLSVEVAELMEHFQWLTPEEAAAVADDPIELQAVGEEMADVLCYLLALANALRLDLASTTAAKMVKNAVKYPVP